MAENILLGFGNWAGEAAYSGGSWLAALPASNLGTLDASDVARSSDALLASTIVDLALPNPRPVRIVGVKAHNLSVQALYRITASKDGWSTTAYDSGWVDVWPIVYPMNVLPWGSPNWWAGRYTQEEIAGYDPPLLHVLPSTMIAADWRIEFDDEGNTDGYVQAGRVFLGDAWSPEVNMDHDGFGLGWKDPSQVQRALSGARIADALPKYRVVRFITRALTESEAYGSVFEIQRQVGITGEVIFIYDPSDTVHAIRRNIWGALAQLSEIQYPYPPHHSAAWEVEESK